MSLTGGKSKTKTTNEPIRRCIGCKTRKPKKRLIRIVLWNESPLIDVHQKMQSRGVYLCGETCANKVNYKAIGGMFSSIPPKGSKKTTPYHKVSRRDWEIIIAQISSF